MSGLTQQRILRSAVYWRRAPPICPLVAFLRVTREGGASYTTRPHDTHSTDSREMRYPWHPWYGHPIWIRRFYARGGLPVFQCSLIVPQDVVYESVISGSVGLVLS
jgi:hypothetical protein